VNNIENTVYEALRSSRLFERNTWEIKRRGTASEEYQRSSEEVYSQNPESRITKCGGTFLNF